MYMSALQDTLIFLDLKPADLSSTVRHGRVFSTSQVQLYEKPDAGSIRSHNSRTQLQDAVPWPSRQSAGVEETMSKTVPPIVPTDGAYSMSPVHDGFTASDVAFWGDEYAAPLRRSEWEAIQKGWAQLNAGIAAKRWGNIHTRKMNHVVCCEMQIQVI
jgi:hypothetical protein